MVKRIAPPLTQEEADAPTRKLTVPAELRDVHSTLPAPSAAGKPRKSETDERERAKSGTRPAVSEEALERFERRETRETVPAPADPPGIPEEVARLVAERKR